MSQTAHLRRQEEERRRRRRAEEETKIVETGGDFHHGGVWIIGHRCWGALLAKSLLHFGIITVCVDYRKFPQCVVGDMVEDVANGIGFVINKVKELGGDPRKINVIGQSVGAHPAALALLKQCKGEESRLQTQQHQENWRPDQIIGFVGISGVYSPEAHDLIEHFDKQGLHKSIFFSIMEAGFTGGHIEALPRNSPSALVREIGLETVHRLPRFLLIHGEKDISSPPSESRNFASALRATGISCSEKYYKDKGHVEPFICDPILGRSEDVLLEDILSFVCLRDGLSKTYKRLPLMRPRFVIEIAKRIVPF